MSAVQFLTRSGCLLCSESLPVVAAGAARRRHVFEVVDVDQAGWQERYGERVPVVLRDGVEVLSGRFDARDVRRALR